MKNMLLRSLLEIKRPTVTCTMQSPETLCLLPKTKLHIVTNWNNQFTWIHWLVLKKTRKSWYSVTKQFNRPILYWRSCSKTAKALSSLNKSSKGVGVDVELLSAINIDNETFIERNFTGNEVEYCLNTAHPQASFTGTWSAKEAVFKARVLNQRCWSKLD